MALEVLRRIENKQNGTFTLVIGEPGEDPGAYYHYSVEPPENIVGEFEPGEWERQTIEHAIALEQTTRGQSPAKPARLGPPDKPVADVQTSAQTADLEADPNDLPPDVTRRPGDWKEPPEASTSAVDERDELERLRSERGSDAGSSA